MKEKAQASKIIGLGGAQRAESPEKLNDYIRITSAGSIFVIIALAVFAVTYIIWGFYGTLPVTETVTGVVDGSNNNNITCFMDASRFSGRQLQGKDAVIRLSDNVTVTGVVDQVRTTPVSKEEASAWIENDWLTSNLVTSSYSILITIQHSEDLSDYSYELAQVSIVTEEVKPISFLTRNTGGAQ